MKITISIISLLLQIITLTCAVMYYSSEEYVRACFWMIWFVSVRIYDINNPLIEIKR